MIFWGGNYKVHQSGEDGHARLGAKLKKLYDQMTKKQGGPFPENPPATPRRKSPASSPNPRP